MPSDAHVSQQTKPSLVQVTACRLFGAKPLYQTIMAFVKTEHCKQIYKMFLMHDEPSAALSDNASNPGIDGRAVKFHRYKIYTLNKAIHEKWHHEFVIEALKNNVFFS